MFVASHATCFYEEASKIISELSSNTLLFKGCVTMVIHLAFDQI